MRKYVLVHNLLSQRQTPTYDVTASDMIARTFCQNSDERR